MADYRIVLELREGNHVVPVGAEQNMNLGDTVTFSSRDDHHQISVVFDQWPFKEPAQKEISDQTRRTLKQKGKFGFRCSLILDDGKGEKIGWGKDKDTLSGADLRVGKG